MSIFQCESLFNKTKCAQKVFTIWLRNLRSQQGRQSRWAQQLSSVEQTAMAFRINYQERECIIVDWEDT